MMDATTALRQAWKTSLEYYEQISHALDRAHGPGYAKKNPALLAVLVTAASNDFNTAALCGWIDDGGVKLVVSKGELEEGLES